MATFTLCLALVGITFSEHIEPIIRETCASCHTGNGPGAQHVRFDTGCTRDVRGAFAMAVTKVRFMPPWPAGDESVPFDHDWSLTDEEIASIAEWDDAKVDPGVTEPSFVSLMEFMLQQTQVVHHAVGFLVGAQDRAVIAELEGSDGQGEWT